MLGARGVRAEALELALISVCVLLIGFGRSKSWCQGLDYHYTLPRGLLDIYYGYLHVFSYDFILLTDFYCSTKQGQFIGTGIGFFSEIDKPCISFKEI